MLTLQITTGVQCMCYRLVFVVYVVCELLHCMYCPCRACTGEGCTGEGFAGTRACLGHSMLATCVIYVIVPCPQAYFLKSE